MRTLPAPANILIVLSRILVASAIFYFASRTYVDPDLWWHLKSGLNMWQSKIITFSDPYSFLTFNSHWINHEWLFEVVIAAIYSSFGWFGLVVFKAFLSLTILLLIFPLLKSWELDDFGIGLLLLLIALFLTLLAIAVRPHLISGVFLTILLLFLRGFPKRAHSLFLLPLIFLFWVNLHGGFIIGLLTLLAYAVIYTFLNPTIELRKSITLLWAITLICWLISLVNPYGLELPLLVINSCIMPHPNITEWQPIEFLSAPGILWAIVVVISILSLGAYKGPKNLTRIILWFPFAAAPLVSVRYFSFFAITTVLLIGEHLIFMWKPVRKSKSMLTKWGGIDIAFALTSIVISLLLIAFTLSFYVNPRIAPGTEIPKVAMGLLKCAKIKGNLLVDFDWGGYAIWHLYPDLKVSIDGRGEVVYSPRALLANTLFTSGTGSWDYILNNFPIDAILTRNSSPACNLMKLKPRWELVYNDNMSAIFLPINSPKLLETKNILSQISIENQAKQLQLPIF